MESSRGRAVEPGLLKVLEEGVLRVRSGRVVEANLAMRNLLERGDVIGRSVSELFADPAGRPLAGLRSLEAAHLRTPDGQLKAISVRRATDEVFIVVDRSRERRLEEEIWALGKGGTSAANPLAPLSGEVAALLEHELSTVYTAVRGQLRLLADGASGALDGTQRACLHAALRAVERGDALARNLVALLRGECSGLASVRKPLALHDVLRHAAELARPACAAAGVTLEQELAAEDDRLLGDPDWLEQVFANLLSNAVRHAPRGSSIQLNTSVIQLVAGESLCVVVRDAGPGVAADQVERIFEPFVRGAGGGAGLGLAVCRRVVSAHGGSIEAVPGNGGLFRVLLPRGTRGGEGR